jgi:excisionase family DNA binding protein
MTADAPVSLSEAASLLGVHYQTAYRWVRQGLLPAAKVGGAYQVRPAAVTALLAERSAPAPPPARRQVQAWAALGTRALDALLAGEEARFRELVGELVLDGVTMQEICDHLFAPILAEIGERWMAGEIGIAEEHRASTICERAIGRWSSTPPGRPRGVAVVCSPPEDEHQLPGHMATAVLRERRWRVHHLGIGVPIDEVASLATREGAHLIVISVAWPPARATADAMAERLATPGRRVLAGRPGLRMADLVALADAAEADGSPGEVLADP